MVLLVTIMQFVITYLAIMNVNVERHTQEVVKNVFLNQHVALVVQMPIVTQMLIMQLDVFAILVSMEMGINVNRFVHLKVFNSKIFIYLYKSNLSAQMFVEIVVLTLNVLSINLHVNLSVNANRDSQELVLGQLTFEKKTFLYVFFQFYQLYSSSL